MVNISSKPIRTWHLVLRHGLRQRQHRRHLVTEKPCSWLPVVRSSPSSSSSFLNQAILSAYSTTTDTTNRFYTSSSQSGQPRHGIKVRQINVSDLAANSIESDDDDDEEGDDEPNGDNFSRSSNKNSVQKHGSIYVYDPTDLESSTALWKKLLDDGDERPSKSNNKNNKLDLSQSSQKALALLLPAGYPKSVAPGYTYFAGFCFTASIAGSAAMVLSTQTLLLAVGVVGQNVQQASVMAGAWNWVLKDFVGQLGGVIFASQMGKTRAFDTDPKRWRCLAALALDGATLLEILSPLFHSSMVLPVASVANIGKNIGFLTASASRAALHNAVAITGNLGDVTAKAGSQSIMASLIGTSLGIGLSSLLQHDTYNFALGFLGLTIIHQGCNYLSVQHVPLAHLNKQRLCIVLEMYIREYNTDNTASSQSSSSSSQKDHGVLLSPADVAKVEQFFPLTAPMDTTKDWLRIGRPITQVFADPSQLNSIKSIFDPEPYIIQFDVDGTNNDTPTTSPPIIDLLFKSHATGEDLIKGMLHACLLRKELSKTAQPRTTNEDPMITTNTSLQSTFQQTTELFPIVLEAMHSKGWNTSTDVTHVESSTSCRFEIETVVPQTT